MEIKAMLALNLQCDRGFTVTEVATYCAKTNG